MSKILIILALQILDCNQKTLAEKLDVSTAQVSKWKSDEYMSGDMEVKISDLIGIGEREPDLILATGSIENTDKWTNLIDYITERIIENGDANYKCDTFEATSKEEKNLFYSNIFSVLKNLKVNIPQDFPVELDTTVNSYLDSDLLDDRQSVYSLIKSSLHQFYSLNDFYITYILASENIDNINDATDDDIAIPTSYFEYELLQYAFCKDQKHYTISENYNLHNYETVKNIKEHL